MQGLDRPEARRLIDMVRALGILQVVLFHVFYGLVRFAPPEDLAGLRDRVPSWMNFGWQTFGVDAVFLVSAFLLTHGLLRDTGAGARPDWRRFYLRRLARILPLYWLAVVIYGAATGGSAGQILLSALFCATLTGVGNVVPVGWSMEVMMLYYLALPFLVGALSRVARPALWLGAAALGIFVIRTVVLGASDLSAARAVLDFYEGGEPHPMAQALYYQPWSRLSPFFLGSALAYGMAARHTPLPAWMAPVGLCVAAAVFWLPLHDATAWVYTLSEGALTVILSLREPLFSAALALFLASSLSRGAPVAGRFKGPWTWVSGRIFGIYLFHMPFILLAAYVVFGEGTAALGAARQWQIWATFALTAGLSAGFAWVVTRFVERPALAVLRKRLGAD